MISLDSTPLPPLSPFTDVEPGPARLHETFEAQADRTPDAPALVSDDGSLTYRELEARANRLAHHLIALGVGPEVRVGVFLGRSTETVVSILAVLKAGGAYVPLDPAYPAERVAFMLEDSRAAGVLTDESRRSALPSSPGWTVSLDGDARTLADRPATRPFPSAQPDGVAYLIYTSGSTGRPKGVMIRHRSAAGLVAWARQLFTLEELEGVLAATSFCFDLSVFELFVPLSRGGTVVLARDALALPEAARLRPVTLVNTVPSAIAELLRAGAVPASVRTVNLAGEALPGALVDGLYQAGVERVYNLYGPSEDTTYSTWALVPSGSAHPPIGVPVTNTWARVLVAASGGEAATDPRQVAAGEEGDLHLGGEGLARGYHDRPDLTAERFVPDPWAETPGERLYRTGDLVRQLPDGTLLYLGRIDQQVKIRGFRIELGEVEAALSRHPSVREAAVAALEGPPGERRLVGFLVPEPDTALPTVRALRRFLRESLPEPMVPPAFTAIAALPRTVNGKLDRKALANLEGESLDAGTVDAGPGVVTATGERLAALWRDLLGLAAPVGPHDDFFDLGGHSLLATRLVSRLREGFGVELSTAEILGHPTVAALAARIDALAAPRSPVPPVVPVPRGGDLPLSLSQQQFFFLDRLAPGHPVYDLPAAWWLTGNLNEAALERAFGEVLRRHEALRATFGLAGGMPVQRVQPATPFTLPRVDLRALPGIRRDAELGRLLRQEAAWRFDLVGLRQGPLLRALLIRVDGESRALTVNVHHIAADGWSLSLLATELRELYGAFREGAASPLPELPVQYADFAVWQRRWLTADRLAPRLAYWKEKLAGVTPLDLPADRPRPAIQTFRGRTLGLTVPAGLRAEVVRFARRAGATPFMALLTGFQALIHRLSGGEEAVVGAPIAQRGRREIEDLIGLFINTLVLRSDLASGPSFRELLAQVRSTALEAYAHQELPAERLVEELHPNRDLSRNPLFQCVFQLLDDAVPLALAGVTAAPLPVDNGTSQFDLGLTLTEGAAGDAGGWSGRLESSSDLFDETTARRWAAMYLRLLEAAVAGPDLRLADLPLLDGAERHQVLEEWNDTVPQAEPLTVPARLAERAAATPDAVAVCFEDESLTYGELLRRARGLAARLAAGVAGSAAGSVGPETLVGLALERSPALVTALLGIWEAGAAYLPLDPTYPAERLALILEDAGAPLVVTDEATRERLALPRERTVLLEDGAVPEEGGAHGAPQAGDLAYVIYTSGSTGRPKGVRVEHGSLARILAACRDELGFRAGDVMAVLAPYSFDIFLFELLSPLLAGGTAVLVPARPALDIAQVVALLPGLTRLHAVPSLMRQVVAAARPLPEKGRRLATLFVGGDAVPPDLLTEMRRVFPAAEVRVLYGPTEGTILASSQRVDDVASLPRAPLGRPLPGVELRVADGAGRPLPIGVPGEIWIGGAGVTRGYLGRDALTAERFPEVDGRRFYRTGDLGRWLAGGTLEFLGRADAQVKVRGVRVEPGEIEAVLASHPAVREAAVLPHAEPGGDHYLVAYVEAPGDADAAGLRTFLQGRLPSAMIPSAFVLLPALPLTTTGKVDRRALAALPVTPAAEGGPVLFATLTQEVLAAIWSDLLGTDRVTPGASFFDLGGHSLLAHRLLTRVRDSFDVELPIRTLFESPTLAGFAARIDQALHAGSERDLPPVTPISRDGDLPLSFVQQQFFFLDQLEPGHPVYDIPVAWRLTGALDEAALERVFGEVLRRHEALRAVFGLDALGEGQPVQRVLPAAPFNLPRIDLRALPEGRRDRELGRLLRQEAAWRFDLVDLRRGPLLRAHLFRQDGESRVLLVNVHHIAADGWSLSLLLTRELRALYDAFRQGLPAPLPELAVQYADFAAWQRRWVTRESLAPHLAYWTRKLAGVAPLELPADRPRPAVQTFRGRTLTLAVPAGLREAVAGLARREGATAFMALLAAFQVLLHRTSGRDDLAVGVPVAQRGRRELEELIGPFINTLVLRSSLAAGTTYRELLAQARTTALEAYAHQELPAERLVEDLHPVRDLSRNPLFQCMFQLLDGSEPLALAGVEAEPLLADNGTSQFDLGLTLSEGGRQGGWIGQLETSSELFDETTVRRWAGRYLRLLAAAVAAPEGRAADLPLLDEAERHQVLVEWNDRQGESETRVLDAAGRLLPIGVPGEIWEGETRTGEVGRWQAGGTLEILGRADAPLEAGPIPAPASIGPTAPATQTQEVLAAVWSDLLDVDTERVTPAASFFDLGGHSLLAYRLISRVRESFGVELTIRALFESPALAAFAARVDQALRTGAGQGLPPVTPVPRTSLDTELPLSFSQQRLLFLDRLMPGNPVYNLPLSFRIAGPLAVPALARALREIVRRHEVLRTSFVLEDDKAFLRVAPPAPLPLPRVDLRGLPPSVREAELLRRSEAEARQPFDLLRGPVLRAVLIQLHDGDHEEHALLLNLHHIATDAWSLEVMLRELSDLYGAFVDGRPSPLPELPVQYADYAAWQRRWLAGEALEAEARWWRERLAGAPMVLELPADRPRPAVQTHRGVTLSIPLPRELGAGLARLGRCAGATLFMTLLAGFQALLARLAGQDDVLVAVPAANRGRREVEGLIGFFINTLVLRARFWRGAMGDEPGFAALLSQVREAALGAYAHQDLPFERLVEELQPERDTSRTPIAQVMFQLLTGSDTPLRLAGAQVRALPRDSGAARMDLQLAVVQADGWLVAFAEYATDLFDATTILRLVEQYGCLLEAVVADPRRRLSEIPLLDEGGTHQILHEWNDTARPAPVPRRLQEVFEAQAARTPEATALVAAGRSMTYGELEAAANRLARRLQARGVGPETRVGIFLDRSADLVVSVLGVLKAGGAYLPLDPAYPRERLAFMLADAAAAGAITREDLAGSLPPVPWAVHLDRDREILAAEDSTRPACDAEPENLAYVIYTSGSTGRPKGVAIRHRAAAEMVAWAGEVFSPDMTAVTLASTSICFDLSVFELFLPLSQGSRVVLVRDALALASTETAAGEGVTLVNTVPSAMTGLVQAGAVPASVTTVGLAGEPLPGALVHDIHRLPGGLPGNDSRRVFNLYGPSEDTTYSTWALVRPGTRLPPIGRPVSNTRAYVVDRAFQPVPLGVAGELCLGGEGLARGYLGRPELTAERFVPDPWSGTAGGAGGRLYRTGDLVRALPDGELRLLGRLDHQVKVRGFRIELGEVEAALLGHPAVLETVVVTREDTPGEKRLVAYLATAGTPVSADELRELLRRTLPEYMVPSAFVVLPELPHTPNGKVDRKALPAPDVDARPAGGGAGEAREPVEPRTPTEAGLVKIWKKVLGIERLGVQDSFFDVGGHSLLALHVVTRIRGQFGLDLPLAAMFRAPTIESMAALIDGQAPTSTSPVILMGGTGIPKTPFFCVHGVGGNVFRLRELSQLLGRPFYGIQGWSDLKDISYLGSVDAMVSRYLEEIRKVQPEGPYLLGGICVGCHIAFEMARRLAADGRTVAHLVFLDTQAGGQADGALNFASLEAAVADELGIPVARQRLLALPPEGRLEYLVREGRRSQALPPGFTTADARRYIEVFRLNLNAWNEHRPTPWEVRATLFAGEGLEGDPSAGWNAYALAGCGFVEVTGDHATMLRSPHVEGLAAKLARVLDDEEARLRD